MATAKAFSLKTAGPLYFVEFCVEGMHVDEVGDGGIAIAPRRTVTPCDGSCANLPVLEEHRMSDGMVAAFRSQLITKAEAEKEARRKAAAMEESRRHRRLDGFDD